MLSNLLIANKSQKIALDIVYFMTQLDAHQTDFTLLVQDNLYDYIDYIDCSSITCFVFVCLLCFFGSFFRHRGCDEQKVRFLYRNGAVYLRSSLWPDLCNNFTLKLFSCEYCKTLASLEILLRGRDITTMVVMVVTCTIIDILMIR